MGALSAIDPPSQVKWCMGKEPQYFWYSVHGDYVEISFGRTLAALRRNDAARGRTAAPGGSSAWGAVPPGSMGLLKDAGHHEDEALAGAKAGSTARAGSASLPPHPGARSHP